MDMKTPLEIATAYAADTSLIEQLSKVIQEYGLERHKHGFALGLDIKRKMSIEEHLMILLKKYYPETACDLFVERILDKIEWLNESLKSSK